MSEQLERINRANQLHFTIFKVGSRRVSEFAARFAERETASLRERLEAIEDDLKRIYTVYAGSDEQISRGLIEMVHKYFNSDGTRKDVTDRTQTTE